MKYCFDSTFMPSFYYLAMNFLRLQTLSCVFNATHLNYHVKAANEFLLFNLNADYSSSPITISILEPSAPISLDLIISTALSYHFQP